MHSINTCKTCIYTSSYMCVGMVNLHEKYEVKNNHEASGKQAPFTLERYEQFFIVDSQWNTILLDSGCEISIWVAYFNKQLQKIIKSLKQFTSDT